MKRSRSCRVNRWIGFAIASCLTVWLVVSGSLPAIGQFALPSPTAQDGSRPPAGVQRYGAIETAPVTFEGDELFRVVAPTVRDRSKPGDLIPVEIRADEVKANLRRVISEDLPDEVQQQRGYNTNFDPKTLEIFPTTLNKQTVIVAKDAYRSQLLDLVSVTDLDAAYHGVTVDELANRWQTILYTKLLRELEERSPATIERNIGTAIYIGVGTVVLSLLLWLAQRLVNNRYKDVKARLALLVADPIAANPTPAELVSSSPEVTAAPATTDVNTLQRQLSLKRRRNLVGALRGLLSLGQIALWLSGLALILNLFPQTRQLGSGLSDVPIRLVVIWFVASLLNWTGDLLIDRLAYAWEDDQFSAFLFAVDDAQRKTLRVSTIIKALRGLKTFLVFCVGIGWALQTMGVPIASVLAGGAIVAFAITLAFQSLAKDLINGCLILWEDQYGIGDVVSIGGSTGLVENMNLRVTQLRDGEGRLITIPNSSIAKVENLTRTWSRVDFDIEVDYDTNIDQVLEVIGEVTDKLYREPEWHDRIVDPPEVLGIDRLSHAGTQIRVWIKTHPSQQWLVGREFRRRVWSAFHQHGIRIGTPQQALRYDPETMPELSKEEESGKKEDS